MTTPTWFLTLLVLPLTLISTGPVVGQPTGGADPDPELQQLIRKLHAQGDFHGGILIAEGEEVILQEAWGIADHEEGLVLTPEHRFNVNSMGKMFTAILAMQLVEEGTLALDDPLSHHLPQFNHPRSEDVTIHMLLSHRSGIPDYFINQLRGEIPMEADLTSILRTVAGMELDFEPGTMFHYSNTGYVLLGMIIERKYGKSFAEVLDERLFQPLGMEDTAHDVDVFGDRVPTYYTEDGRINDSAYPFIASDGGQTSSLRDMHRFMLALGSERLLSEESWERIFTPHSLPSEVPEGAWPPPHQDPYGYGFSVPQLPYSEGTTALAAGHGGAGLGSNYAVRFLDSGRIVIVWNNIFKRTNLSEVFEYLARPNSGD
jgi:CubicO group peptidase (beta-lactamase class C family)